MVKLSFCVILLANLWTQVRTQLDPTSLAEKIEAESEIMWHFCLKKLVKWFSFCSSKQLADYLFQLLYPLLSFPALPKVNEYN